MERRKLVVQTYCYEEQEMAELDVRRLELSVNVKSLRFKAISTSMALSLTLVHLAKVEGSIGNRGRASWAAENAKNVQDLLHECLLDAPLNREELSWTEEKLKDLEQAFDSLPSFEPLQFAANR